ncbi:hypothetical protein CsSME_00036304 [Camellia sinensis var. sinensis]
MSRCFPYPLPGYSAKRDSNVALIESIKLQREREEKARTERKKESKREKKEKKSEKEANAKHNGSEFGHGKKRKFNDEKTKKLVEERVYLKGTHIQKNREDEAEQLERSGLTEEHELPVCSRNPCYTSDSTENSSKRRKQLPPVNGIRAHGNIIRIRLTSQKQKESDDVVTKERLTSTSGRTDSTSQHDSEIGLGRSQEFCSTSVGIDASSQVLTTQPIKDEGGSSSGIASIATSYVNKIPKVDSFYKDLIENWVPPLVQSEQTDLGEQEWLFQRKNQDGERCQASSNVLCRGSSTLWPHAQYLPEVDIYALPFTVPF